MYKDLLQYSPYTTLYEYVHTYEGNSVDPTPNFTLILHNIAMFAFANL